MLSKDVFWVQLAPIDPDTGNPVSVRICSENTRRACGVDYSNGEWLPYLITRPDLDINAFAGDFTGEATVAIQSLTATDTVKDGDLFSKEFSSYVWDGTPVTVYKGDHTASVLGDLTPIYTGVVQSSPSTDEGTVSWSFIDNSYLLDVEILNATYDGTGTLGGTAEMEGRYKPTLIGSVLNLEPILIDPVNLVYQYHGYGAAGGVVALWENGLDYGAGQTEVAYDTNDATTYQNLINATLAAGEWVDCPSIGCFRLGGEPAANGVLTVDAIGDDAVGAGNIDDVLNTLMTSAALTAYVDATSFATIFADSGNQTIADYITTAPNLNELLTNYVSQVGGYVYFSSTGTLRVGLVRMGTPALEIRSDATSAPVAEYVNALTISAPYKRLRIGADKVFKVHALNEISDALYQTVVQLQTDLDNIAGNIAIIADDAILSATEKLEVLIPADERLVQEYATLTARATDLSLTFTTTTTAYNAYVASRDGMSPDWDDYTQETDITGNSFRADAIALADELIALNKLISEEDAKSADWPNVTDTGGTRPEDNADVTGSNTAAGIVGQGSGATASDEDVLNTYNVNSNYFIVRSTDNWSIEGGSILRTSGSFGQNGGVIGGHTGRSITVSGDFDFTFTTGRHYIGINDDPSTVPADGSWLASVFLYGQAAERVVFEYRGTQFASEDRSGQSGTASCSYDGAKLRAFIDGVEVGFVDVEPEDQGLDVHFATTSEYSSAGLGMGTTNANYVIAPSTNNWGDVIGDGTPANDATAVPALQTTVDGSAPDYFISASNIRAIDHHSSTSGHYAFTPAMDGSAVLTLSPNYVGSETTTFMFVDAADQSIVYAEAQLNGVGELRWKPPGAGFYVDVGAGNVFATQGDSVSLIYDGVHVSVALNGVIQDTGSTSPGENLTVVGTISQAYNNLAGTSNWSVERIGYGPYNNASFTVLGGLGLDESDFVTADGTASAIAGQGAIATLDDLDLSYITDAGLFAAFDNIDLSYVSDAGAVAGLNTVDWSLYVTGANRPDDNADVTGDNVASAIAGQAAAATDTAIETGADVTKYITGPSTINFAFDSDGNIKGGQTGNRAVVQIVKSSDGSSVTSGVSWVLTVVSGSYEGASPTISGTGAGQINFGTEATTTGRIRATGTLETRQYIIDIDITTTQDDPPTGGSGGGGGGSAGTNVTGNANGDFDSSWVTVYAANVSTDTGVTSVVLTANNNYIWPDDVNVNSPRSGNVQYQWQRETSIGSDSWTDVGAAADSSPDPYYFDEGGFYSPEAGRITCTRTDTGRTAATEYSYRLRARISSGTLNDASIFNGPVSMNGE